MNLSTHNKIPSIQSIFINLSSIQTLVDDTPNQIKFRSMRLIAIKIVPILMNIIYNRKCLLCILSIIECWKNTVFVKPKVSNEAIWNMQNDTLYKNWFNVWILYAWIFIHCLNTCSTDVIFKCDSLLREATKWMRPVIFNVSINGTHNTLYQAVLIVWVLHWHCLYLTSFHSQAVKCAL